MPRVSGQDDVCFLGVFDGTVGDFAADFVHLAIQDALCTSRPFLEACAAARQGAAGFLTPQAVQRMEAALHEGYRACDEQLLKVCAESQPPNDYSSCTSVTVLLSGEVLSCAHLGDSKIVLGREVGGVVVGKVRGRGGTESEGRNSVRRRAECGTAPCAGPLVLALFAPLPRTLSLATVARAALRARRPEACSHARPPAFSPARAAATRRAVPDDGPQARHGGGAAPHREERRLARLLARRQALYPRRRLCRAPAQGRPAHAAQLQPRLRGKGACGERKLRAGARVCVEVTRCADAAACAPAAAAAAAAASPAPLSPHRTSRCTA